MRSFAKYWLPVVIWMVVIFSASGDSQSAEHSSRIIAPIVRWLMPSISDANLDTIVFIARKGAHLTEYAILGILLWRALRKPERQVVQPWVWSEAGVALLIGVVYAGSDEFHQIFVPTRQGQIVDVLVDVIGVFLGLTLVWFCIWLGQRRSGRV